MRWREVWLLVAEYTTSIEIHASAETIFDFLLTPEGITAWMGQHATLDPHPGGSFQVNIAGSPVRGEYIEIVRPERVVVSWGVAGSDELPPGASRVSFTLTRITGGTRVDLRHWDLPDPLVAGHTDGWSHFLPRLALAATGHVLEGDDWVPLPLR